MPTRAERRRRPVFQRGGSGEFTMSAPQIVTGYREGKAFQLLVDEVECGKLMDARLVRQIKETLQVGRESVGYISISSAFRTMEQQQDLYEKWKAGIKGYNPADPPGFSAHQDGTAIDLAFDSGEAREEFAALALAHGFSRPTHEAWHFVGADIDKTPVEGAPIKESNT